MVPRNLNFAPQTVLMTLQPAILGLVPFQAYVRRLVPALLQGDGQEIPRREVWGEIPRHRLPQHGPGPDAVRRTRHAQLIRRHLVRYVRRFSRRFGSHPVRQHRTERGPVRIRKCSVHRYLFRFKTSFLFRCTVLPPTSPARTKRTPPPSSCRPSWCWGTWGWTVTPPSSKRPVSAPSRRRNT